MDEPITSEEKLLKIIRKKPKDAAAGKPVAVKEKGTNPAGIFSSARFFSAANRILLVSCCVIAGYLVFRSVAFLKQPPAAKISESEPAAEENIPSAIDLPQESPGAEYQQIIEARDIFQAPWEKEQALPQAEGGVPAINLNQEFKLVGIVLDRDPKAIIEDLKTQQTVFMSEGEVLRGARLEDIQADKVIFNYNSMRVELTQ